MSNVRAHYFQSDGAKKERCTATVIVEYPGEACSTPVPCGYPRNHSTHMEPTITITDADATRIGKAIAEAAEMRQWPIRDEMERRAICLKLATETRSYTIRTEAGPPIDHAQQVIAVANVFLEFIEGRDSA